MLISVWPARLGIEKLKGIRDNAPNVIGYFSLETEERVERQVKIRVAVLYPNVLPAILRSLVFIASDWRLPITILVRDDFTMSL